MEREQNVKGANYLMNNINRINYLETISKIHLSMKDDEIDALHRRVKSKKTNSGA